MAFGFSHRSFWWDCGRWIEYKTDTFEELIGTPPRSLEDFIEEHKNLYTS